LFWRAEGNGWTAAVDDGEGFGAQERWRGPGAGTTVTLLEHFYELTCEFDSEGPMASTPEDRRFETLGEQSINRDAFELDLKVNEGFQDYSAELLRLSLLAISGLSVVWLKIYVPDTAHTTPPHGVRFFMATCFGLLAVSAAAALMHRYMAAYGLTYHLTALREYKRALPASEGHRSDVERAGGHLEKRRIHFFRCRKLLSVSAIALFIGVVVFGFGMWSLT
jgi:hypothetical protein